MNSKEIQNPLNFLDHVWVINMDRHSKRLEQISKVLDNLNIPYNRFAGICISKEDVEKSHLINEDKLYERWKSLDCYPIGVLGCKLSHLSVLRILKDIRSKSALILEDDVLFEDDAMEYFQTAWIELHSRNIDWDILYLGANIRGKIQLVGDNLAKVVDPLSFSGYVINGEKIDKIIQLIESSDVEVDLVAGLASRQGDLKTFCVWPNITIVDDGVTLSSLNNHHTLIRWRDRYFNTKVEDIRDKYPKTTVVIKTFIRLNCCQRLVKSIRQYYPKIPIVIVDDSQDYNESLFDDPNITYIHLDYNSGLSKGRNIALEYVKTNYFLLCDDDFIFNEKTIIQNAEEILDSYSSIDMVGGLVDGVYYHGITKKVGEEINFYLGKAKKQISDHNIYDIIPNFFLARTEKIKEISWDEELKMVEHSEFFWRAKNYDLSITYIGDKMYVDHKHEDTLTYKEFRYNTDKYLELAYEKMGITKINIIR